MWGCLASSCKYYASRLSVARGKFGTQVLPLNPDVVIGNSACFHLKHLVVLTSSVFPGVWMFSQVTSQQVVGMSDCQHASVESLLQRLFSRGGKMRGYFTDQNIQSFEELSSSARQNWMLEIQSWLRTLSALLFARLMHVSSIPRCLMETSAVTNDNMGFSKVKLGSKTCLMPRSIGKRTCSTSWRPSCVYSI